LAIPNGEERECAFPVFSSADTGTAKLAESRHKVTSERHFINGLITGGRGQNSFDRSYFSQIRL
jgi:hypothetical protein